MKTNFSELLNLATDATQAEIISYRIGKFFSVGPHIIGHIIGHFGLSSVGGYLNLIPNVTLVVLSLTLIIRSFLKEIIPPKKKR